MNQLARGHTGEMWQNWQSNPGPFATVKWGYLWETSGRFNGKYGDLRVIDSLTSESCV